MKKGLFKTSVTAKWIGKISLYLLPVLLSGSLCFAQQKNDTTKGGPYYKNIIRYNLSGAILFGFNRYVVFGYERVVTPHQSFSINVGLVSLPTLVNISTDSFNLSHDKQSGGFNLSVDYRFYLAKENKYPAPHGLYIGPFYSYNHFTRDNDWEYKNSGASSSITSHSVLNIHTIGGELGYQFILWKRLAIDLVLVGPGLGFYNYSATFDSNIDAATKEQLLEGIKQLITQKFPGMNYVFANKEFNANGTIHTSTIGYRYIVHIGFNF
ncbi:MAG TPA: hypothetical protein VMI12_07000 [Puia sp.]|nr:hypothetical protein [Puia sp.]